MQIKYDDNKDIALTIVVPTYNEKLNVRPLVSLLDKALVDINWEVVFVDDDSPDGTADEVRELARTRLDVRVIHRIGRRGLSGACIEGILSSAAPYVAVMDGDLQHDETVLISMIASFNADPELNLVIGSRNVEGGSSGNGLSGIRSFGSDMATVMARKLLKIRVQDPMSGFFMIKLESFRDVVGELQRQGFKILTDLLSASRGSWKIKEIPFVFKERQYGQSKMDSAVTLEYFGLILARLTGGAISIRFVLFLFVGLTGILVQLLMVGIFLNVMFLSFFYSQILAVILAMTSNFFLNNILTLILTALMAFFYAVANVVSRQIRDISVITQTAFMSLIGFIILFFMSYYFEGNTINYIKN